MAWSAFSGSTGNSFKFWSSHVLVKLESSFRFHLLVNTNIKDLFFKIFIYCLSIRIWLNCFLVVYFPPLKALMHQIHLFFWIIPCSVMVWRRNSEMICTRILNSLRWITIKKATCMAWKNIGKIALLSSSFLALHFSLSSLLGLMLCSYSWDWQGISPLSQDAQPKRTIEETSWTG